MSNRTILFCNAPTPSLQVGKVVAPSVYECEEPGEGIDPETGLIYEDAVLVAAGHDLETAAQTFVEAKSLVALLEAALVLFERYAACCWVAGLWVVAGLWIVYLFLLFPLSPSRPPAYVFHHVSLAITRVGAAGTGRWRGTWSGRSTLRL